MTSTVSASKMTQCLTVEGQVPHLPFFRLTLEAVCSKLICCGTRNKSVGTRALARHYLHYRYPRDTHCAPPKRAHYPTVPSQEALLLPMRCLHPPCQGWQLIPVHRGLDGTFRHLAVAHGRPLSHYVVLSRANAERHQRHVQ